MTKRDRSIWWAGFVNGKLYVEVIDDTYGAHFAPAVFRSIAEARRQYQDVRPVTITTCAALKKRGRK